MDFWCEGDILSLLTAAVIVQKMVGGEKKKTPARPLFCVTLLVHPLYTVRCFDWCPEQIGRKKQKHTHEQ